MTPTMFSALGHPPEVTQVKMNGIYTLDYMERMTLFVISVPKPLYNMITQLPPRADYLETNMFDCYPPRAHTNGTLRFALLKYFINWSILKSVAEVSVSPRTHGSRNSRVTITICQSTKITVA